MSNIDTIHDKSQTGPAADQGDAAETFTPNWAPDAPRRPQNRSTQGRNSTSHVQVLRGCWTTCR